MGDTSAHHTTKDEIKFLNTLSVGKLLGYKKGLENRVRWDENCNEYEVINHLNKLLKGK